MRVVDILEKTATLNETTRQACCGGEKTFNRSEAEMRLWSLKRNFYKDPNLVEKYHSTMNDYIAKGYARKLTPEEASKSGPRT